MKFAPLLISLIGCSATESACQDYLITSAECTDEALGGSERINETAIEKYCQRSFRRATADEKRDAREDFRCASDALRGLDCSDLDAYNEATAEAAACFL